MLEFIFVIFVIALFSLATTGAALDNIKRYRSKQQMADASRLFFYRKIHNYFFRGRDFDTVLFAIDCTKNIIYFCFAVVATMLLFKMHLFPITFKDEMFAISEKWPLSGLIILVFALIAIIFGDFLPQILSVRYTKQSIRATGAIASIFLIICMPISFIFLKLQRLMPKAANKEQDEQVLVEMKEKIVEMLQEAKMNDKFSINDKKIIESIVTFRDRVVREIMVPRVDVLTLPSTTTVKEAAKILQEEGFSRTPVYRENVDNIIGLLMHKDILNVYMSNDPKQLDMTVEHLVKSIIFTPETKKISVLLQEFRQKQTHLAVVVDEYGGTEGIVTIEDILEEIVGEIEDEYDTEEELFTPLPSGGWIVDAKMSILDIENEFGLQIPQKGDYDTVGGYIFHKAGSIPSKGFIIHHDQFELEVLNSNERCVEKVKITPIKEENE